MIYSSTPKSPSLVMKSRVGALPRLLSLMKSPGLVREMTSWSHHCCLEKGDDEEGLGQQCSSSSSTSAYYSAPNYPTTFTEKTGTCSSSSSSSLILSRPAAGNFLMRSSFPRARLNQIVRLFIQNTSSSSTAHDDDKFNNRQFTQQRRRRSPCIIKRTNQGARQNTHFSPVQQSYIAP